MLLVVLWLYLLVWQVPVERQIKSNTQELRGVWMTNVGTALMYYTTRMDEVMAHLAQYRLNTVYTAVWNQGYTLHPSRVALRAGSLSRAPLQRLLIE